MKRRSHCFDRDAIALFCCPFPFPESGKILIADRKFEAAIGKVNLHNRSTNTMKAQVATIDLGFAKFDGLMLPSGEYAIAVPQIASLIQSTQNYASQEFKRLLGEGFNPSKQSIEGTKALVNVVSLQTFTKILYAKAKQGNAIADSLVGAMLDEGFERRFDTAFGKKVSEAEYNERLALRMKRLMARHAWTDVLRDRHIQCFGVKPKPDQYKDWTVAVNEALFGRRHFQCDRDTMAMEEQQLIESFEYTAVRKAKKHPSVKPDELLDLVLSTF